MRLIRPIPIAAAVLVVAHLGVASPAAAQTTCEETSPNCEVTIEDTPPTTEESTGPSGDPNARIWTYFLGTANEWSQLLLPPGTTHCYNTTDDGNMTLAEATAAAFAQPDAPGCPDLSGLGGLPGVGGFTELVAAMAPPPDPTIRPGRNVTGLKAYLETGLDAPAPQVRTVGPVRVTFDLVLQGAEVDWGDGTAPESYDRPGVSYQDRDGRSEITHVYARSGEGRCEEAEYGATCFLVTVQGTWTWTARVEGGAADGQVFGPFQYVDPNQGDLTLPVEEVQAVRNR